MRQWCNFGLLLEEYYRDKDMRRQKDLCTALQGKGRPYSKSTISKYMLGDRRPTVQFIRDVAGCLSLTPDQVRALWDAYKLDLDKEFMDKYFGGNHAEDWGNPESP